MTLRSLAALDDATFDLTATEVVDAVLLLSGRVDVSRPASIGGGDRSP